MDIVIHGTKGGRTIFTPVRLSGLLDVTADSAKSAAIGQEAYAIRFTAEHAIFSKYRIIRDVRGAKRTGFIGFSLFLPTNESLPGRDVITLLDKVSEEYCRKYIVDNNLDDVREVWDFLYSILSEFQSKQKYDERVPSGEKDDAFIYFKDKDELKRYFDAPVQEEYNDYRQVLFVNSEWLAKPENPQNVMLSENPLKALRHSNSNLTGKIDLDNKYYYLKNYNCSRGVTITANGRYCSQEKENNCIRAKSLVEIRYSKDERCYWPIEARGMLYNPTSDINKYLEISDNLIFIKYDAFNNPTPKEKTVHFEIVDHKGDPVYNSEVKLSNLSWQIKGYQHDYTFIGEELICHWTISARKGGDLNGKVSFTLDDNISTIQIVLHERKIVKFNVVDEDGLDVVDYKIRKRNEKGRLIDMDVDDIVFFDDDIYQSWYFIISHSKHYDETFYYSPETGENPKCVSLKSKQFGRVNLLSGNNWKKKRYRLKIDKKFGKRSFKGNEIKDWVSENPDFGVTPRFGYKFEEWLFHEEPSNYYYDGYYEARFKEWWWHKIPKKVWIPGIAAVFALIVAVLFLVIPPNVINTEQPVSQKQIIDYIEGNEFLLDTLNSYKINWKKQEPNTKMWYNPMTWFSEKNVDTTTMEYRQWNDVLRKLGDAKTHRELIDKKDFKALQNQDLAKQFEKAINKIDTAQYDTIIYKLGNVRDLSLIQITARIDSIVQVLQNPQKGNSVGKNTDKHSSDSNSTTKREIGDSVESASTEHNTESKTKKSE